MPESFDVVVVGGGIAGLSVAHSLIARGVRTLVLDNHDPGRATDAGAGILSPATTYSDDDRWIALATACGARYPGLAAELAASGWDPGWACCGLLALAVGDGDREAFRDLAERSLARSRGAGTLREIEPADARARFPVLGDVTAALLNEEAGRVDGRQFAAALAGASVHRGLQIRAGRAERLVRSGRRVLAVETDAGPVRCGAVVVAGGAWSSAIAATLDIPVAVHPMRGQIIHLRMPDADTREWPIAQPVLGHYMVPWPDGRVAVGATMEPNAGFDARATAAGMRQLLSWTLRMAPGLADATFVEVRAGLRPMSDDDLPLLGPVPTVDNVFLATGYGADGLLLSPFSGELVAAAVVGERPAIDLAPFLPGRPAPAGR